MRSLYSKLIGVISRFFQSQTNVTILSLTASQLPSLSVVGMLSALALKSVTSLRNISLIGAIGSNSQAGQHCIINTLCSFHCLTLLSIDYIYLSNKGIIQLVTNCPYLASLHCNMEGSETHLKEIISHICTARK